jgi:hypothetical protein
MEKWEYNSTLSPSVLDGVPWAGLLSCLDASAELRKETISFVVSAFFVFLIFLMDGLVEGGC